MKTFKFKLLIPVVAILFAVTSAFTTSAISNVDVLAVNDGYLITSSPCSQPISCAPSGNELCKNAQGVQAFGKYVESQTTCPRVMYKPN